MPDTDQVTALREQLRAEQEMNLLLTEGMADLELALEDRGWSRPGSSITDEFSAEGRRAMTAICRQQAVSHPLIKRGLLLRIGYIWGQGVQITGRAGKEDPQDVNAVVQRFLDDNEAVLTGSQAREELERALGTDGQVYLACFTSPRVGRVRVRSTPTDEIVDIITDPEDRDEPWFYVRRYWARGLEAGYQPGNTRVRGREVRVAHPALGYRPATRVRTLDGAAVRWDAPILHVPVNRLDGWLYGLPDVYAAVAWARLYRDFLVDWAGLTKSLSKFAWRTMGGSKSQTARAAAAVRANAQAPVEPRPLGAPPAGVGQLAAGSAAGLEAIPKSGAHIDAESGKPLAGMVAAGMGVPVTMLLADPGVTGARATAETLDLPTVLEMGMRRLLWQGKLTELFDYVIDQAVLAPGGPLAGAATIDDWGRRVVTLAGDVERTVDFDWPKLIDIDPVEFVKAVVAADSTEKMPPLWTVRLLLGALGVKDVDEVIAEVTDEQGRWIDPAATAGDVAVDRFRRGDDTAAEALT